jgi:hypothetical protein
MPAPRRNVLKPPARRIRRGSRLLRPAPLPPPGPQLVQVATGNSGVASTTLSATFGSTPTAGNLLVFAMAGDKNTGALTLAGWTPVFELLATSVSLYLAWKVSDGTETTVSPSWATSSAAGNMAWVGEYIDTGSAGAWSLLASASNINVADATSTSQATGTTAATSADGLAVALACIDSGTSVTLGTQAWSGGYVERYAPSGGGKGTPFLAEKFELASATATSTFSFTGTADQLSAAIGVWAKVVAGAPPARAPALTSQYGGFY